MAPFRRNVYETFDRIHQLAGNAEHPDDATAMDRAEYQLAVDNLVEGLVELLQHAATHRLLSLDIGEYDHELQPGDIGVYRDDSDEPAANHTVAIRVPDDALPDEESSLSEALTAFDLLNVETSADLAVAAMARLRMLENRDPELEPALHDAWKAVATTLVPRLVPALRRVEAAGLLTLRNARTGVVLAPLAVTASESEETVEVRFATRPARASGARVANKAVS